MTDKTYERHKRLVSDGNVDARRDLARSRTARPEILYYLASDTAAVACIAGAVFCAGCSSGMSWALASVVAPESCTASLGSIMNFGGYLVLQLRLSEPSGEARPSWRGRRSMAASLEVGGWRAELDGLLARFGRLFVRAEPRGQAGRYLEGLLGPVERKNGWQLAEAIGDARPWRTQRVLSHVLWDEEAARDLCREHVVGRLGAQDAVLVVDETAFVKKGRHSAGVARQYCGTLGKVENCQVGVFLAYGSRKGLALIDRRLYLPEAWAGDAGAAAGWPDPRCRPGQARHRPGP